jgi:type VI secretion system secreted protein VgrG
VGNNQSIRVGNNQTLSVGANQKASIGVDQAVSVGNNQTVTVGARVLVDAGAEIVLRTGASILTMKSDGTITLQGANITVVASETISESAPAVSIAGTNTAKIGVGGQNTVYDTGAVATSGAAINSSAAGKHEITGAVVKIN